MRDSCSDEILPEVAKHYNLSTNPNDRAICGASSGGICSFTVAWTHPEAFRRVLSFIGSFADLRGGDIYPALIRKTEPKPLRVFLQDGSHDLNNFAGDWWLANQSMASALAYAGYDFKFVTGDKDHDMIQGGPIFPDALRWLWRDYPQPIAKPKMRPLGNPHSGFEEFDPDWELVSDSRNLPPKGLGDTISSYAGGIVSQLRYATGMAADQQGNVFFSYPPGKAIYRIDTNGRISTFVDDAEGARGMAFGPEGLLYTCESKGIFGYAADGKRSTRSEAAYCWDLVVMRDGGIYGSMPWGGGRPAVHIPPGISEPYSRTPVDGEGLVGPNGNQLSVDQSILYTSRLGEKWVWSYQVQADGLLAHGEPFFRLETPDGSSESGASGMAVDSNGLLYVATLLGIQVCDSEGRVVAIINRPEQAGPELGPISGVAFGGPDHQYLYIAVGNNIFRRHLVQNPPQP